MSQRIFYFLSLILICLPMGCLALQTEEYISYISNIVYDTCEGQNITLKSNWFIKNDLTGFVNEIIWPYSFTQINDIIWYISYTEPYASNNNMYSGGEITLNNITYNYNRLGQNILVCGQNHLDVYGRDYYWNDVKIEMPKVTNYAVNNQGNLIQGSSISNTQQTQLENCTFNLNEAEKENFWFKYIYPPIISIIGAILTDIILKPKKSKRRLKWVINFGVLLFLTYLTSFLIGFI